MEERDERGRGAATVHVDEYLQMAQASILNEDDRVELLDGERIGRTNAVPSAPSPRDAGGRHAASPAGPSLRPGIARFTGAKARVSVDSVADHLERFLNFQVSTALSGQKWFPVTTPRPPQLDPPVREYGRRAVWPDRAD
jgi:hypothetical protein